MDDKNYLHTSQYKSRRKRRGCFGLFLLALLGLAAASLLTQISFPSGTGLPVFGQSVGVVRIEGPINESKQVIKVIRSFRESPLIKAVVLRLDTPGGAVGASEEIYREVMAIRKTKPVVASMGNAAASGGYYIACGAEEIFTNAGTLTGSIGVIGLDWNLERLLDKFGVQSVVLKSGEHKDTGSPFREMAPEDRRVLQGVVYDTYSQFFRTVLSARHKNIRRILETNPQQIADVLSTPTTKRTGAGLEWEAFTTGSIAAEVGATTDTELALHAMADGRVMTGQQALKLGLVDRIGTMDDAIRRAGEMAGLGKKPPVVERSPESSIPSLLGSHARKFWQAFTRREPAVQYLGSQP